MGLDFLSLSAPGNVSETNQDGHAGQGEQEDAGAGRHESESRHGPWAEASKVGGPVK